jgi:hypothetical protein
MSRCGQREVYSAYVQVLSHSHFAAAHRLDMALQLAQVKVTMAYLHLHPVTMDTLLDKDIARHTYVLLYNLFLQFFCVFLL